ncbi:biotin-dependent carboxyltransferase family protein [Photobacterium sp. TY1-4]|uniref:5-oxoprolinase subunit C family protein n=1 Tax=Photobacterium sp. TY1-4 TaxID=2899122 RepID=UPI0021BE15D5|nr:biotin-dependent carboxyltransferase family protein [Photobacterium sp. TY1-4]UXI02878.1 biotin-dependent carboxyltransferase family protein [Photobacterium sp. TY1-4]
MLTLIQDTGRLGVAELGLSQGGPVDLHAYCWANYLVGNAMNCPQLEVTLGQASFRAHTDLICAITGADMVVTVDGQRQPPWQSFVVHQGQVLKFGYARDGLRAYLAVKGGFDIPRVLGSASAVPRNQLGGLKAGTALAEGDVLPVTHGEINDHAFQPKRAAPRYIPDYSAPVRLRVMESYQCDHFSEQAKQRFYASAYQISQQSDRMGCRLEGPAVEAEINGIISEAIAYGAIQIPPNGQPIILLNDRQTLGGYPKLGCIARMDMPRLAQARPGTAVQFVRGKWSALSKEWQDFSQFFGLPM